MFFGGFVWGCFRGFFFGFRFSGVFCYKMCVFVDFLNVFSKWFVVFIGFGGSLVDFLGLVKRWLDLVLENVVGSFIGVF